jgi:succinoglycan biosynthesis protein ExoU
MFCNEPNTRAGGGFGQRDRRCVDVIIAAWNCEETIGRAIASALAQTEVRTVIVVDDASTDRTVECAYAADDSSARLVIFRFPENRGPAAARNKALSLCTAPWVAVLDGDDYFMLGRFSRMLALAEGWDFIADNLLQIPEDHGHVDVLLPTQGRKSFEPFQCSFETFVLGNIWKPGRDRKELGFLQPLMRRAFLSEHGLRYDEGLRIGEDYAFYARSLAAGARFLIVPTLGYVAVTRRSSLSSSASKKHFERFRDADVAIEALAHLTKAQRAALRAHRKSIDAIVQWLEVIEAVKDRNASRFMAAYSRSLHAAKYISARLAEQIVLRSFKRIRRLIPAAGLAESAQIIPAK